jgi:hypothetical protein
VRGRQRRPPNNGMQRRPRRQLLIGTCEAARGPADACSLGANEVNVNMTNSKRAISIPDGNAAKYFSYREAWGRIKKAQGCGFYLEAVTLEESIISDRLISYLARVGALKIDAKLEKISFNELIKKWSNQVPEPISDQHFDNLQMAVDEWRSRRNQVVHGMVKSVPGSNHGDVINFLKEAELTAFQGDALARAVCRWHKKIKKQITGRDIDCGT